MCKGVKTVPEFSPLHTYKDLLQIPVPVQNCNGSRSLYDEKKTVCLSILSFLGHLYLDVFGPVRMKNGCNTEQRPIFSAISVHLFGAYHGLDGDSHTYLNEPH